MSYATGNITYIFDTMAEYESTLPQLLVNPELSNIQEYPDLLKITATVDTRG